jgi:hypothetical protein
MARTLLVDCCDDNLHAGMGVLETVLLGGCRMMLALYQLAVIWVCAIPFVAGAAAFAMEYDGSPDHNRVLCLWAVGWPVILLALPVVAIALLLYSPIAIYQTWRKHNS